jgi:hypothetical protein
MPSETVRSALRAAVAAAVPIAAVFCFAVGTLMFATQARLVRLDPLNAPALMALRERFSSAPGDEALQRDIRAADREARAVYFLYRERLALGSRLLLCGALALLAGLAALPLLRDPAPDVAKLKEQR